MTTKDIAEIWNAPPLSQEDEFLIEAYIKVGEPLDSLPYTDEFERLVKFLNKKPTRDNLRETHRRLLTLRKRGQLPRVGRYAY